MALKTSLEFDALLAALGFVALVLSVTLALIRRPGPALCLIAAMVILGVLFFRLLQLTAAT